MKPPIRHPTPGVRAPQKPTHAEMEQLLRKQEMQLLGALRRERHLARILVLLFRGTLLERLGFALAILFRRKIRIPFPRLADVHAGQLFATAENKHFNVGADNAPDEEEAEHG